MINCSNCARARRPSFYWKFQLHDDHGQGDDYAYEVDYRENTEDDYYGIPEDVRLFRRSSISYGPFR